MHSPRVFDTSLGLYFAWSTTPLGVGSMHGALARVDQVTGELSVVRATQGTATSLVAVHGSLFVVLSSEGPKVPRGRLARVDATTLNVLRSWTLPAVGTPYATVAAGGALWVAAGAHLERVAPSSGAVTTTLTLEGAASVSLGTNTTGSALVAAGDIATGAYHLERIDSWTGALERRTGRRIGTAGIGGVIRTALWIGVDFGTTGSALRERVRSLRPVGPGCHAGVGTQACVVGSSPRPDLEAGHLYVTTPNAPTRNDCALRTGQVIARLPVDLRHDDVMAIARTSTLLFQVTTSTRRTPTISEASVPASCRSNG